MMFLLQSKRAKDNKYSEKGISVFVSHVLAIGIAISILFIISTHFYSYYQQIVRQSQTIQGKRIAEEVSENLLKLYQIYEDSDFLPEQNKTLGKLKLKIPEKISGRDYIIKLENRSEFWIHSDITVNGSNVSIKSAERPFSKIVIQTEKIPKINLEYNLFNLEIPVEGKVESSDHVILKYIRRNENGKKKDKILLTG